MTPQTATPRSKWQQDAQPTYRQMELFAGDQSNHLIGAPTWPELPAEAQAALTDLIAQLMLQHAAQSPVPTQQEISHDL